jgi:glycosyltransferase involved in cell wall biosynthesis
MKKFPAAYRSHQPRFSFIIPIYDRDRVVHEAIKSCLNQSFDDFEIVAVLDGSPPRTREIVHSIADRRLRVFEYAEPSGTACRARNRGILEAKGQYVAFLDSDDLSSPTRLEAMDRLFGLSDADVGYGGVKFLPEVSRIDGIGFGDVGLPNPNGFTLQDLKNQNQIYILTACVKRQALLRYGGFRVELRYREDYELWLRLKYRGCKFAHTQNVVSFYRIHETNNELNFKDDDNLYYDQSISLHDKDFLDWGV